MGVWIPPPLCRVHVLIEWHLTDAGCELARLVCYGTVVSLYVIHVL